MLYNHPNPRKKNSSRAQNYDIHAHDVHMTISADGLQENQFVLLNFLPLLTRNLSFTDTDLFWFKHLETLAPSF